MRVNDQQRGEDGVADGLRAQDEGLPRQAAWLRLWSRTTSGTPATPTRPSNTADQLRSSVACAGFVSCIRLLDRAALQGYG